MFSGKEKKKNDRARFFNHGNVFEFRKWKPRKDGAAMFRGGVRENMNKFANNECVLRQIESGRGAFICRT